jgi:hypothetical protein
MQSHAGVLGSVREPWAHNWASRNSSQNILRSILAAIIVEIAEHAQCLKQQLLVIELVDFVRTIAGIYAEVVRACAALLL